MPTTRATRMPTTRATRMPATRATTRPTTKGTARGHTGSTVQQFYNTTVLKLTWQPKIYHLSNLMKGFTTLLSNMKTMEETLTNI
mgnify:CR=1 FL=1